MYQLNPNQSYFQTNALSNFHGFGTIKAGPNIEPVAHQQFYKSLFGNKASQYALLTPFQVHGKEILTITETPPSGYSLYPGYDGLLYLGKSTQPVCLFVKSADCLTLILEEPKSGLIGVVHQGWQGALAGIIPTLGERLKELGINLRQVRVALGPSIGDCCYNIPVKRKELFETKYPGHGASSQRGGQHYFSLSRFAHNQLLKIGIKRDNLSYRPFCTACQSDLFFSYRAQSQTPNHLLTFCTNHA